MRLKGIGAEFAAVLYLEGLFRHFDNRRQLTAVDGLCRSGSQSIEEWQHRARTRYLEGRQSASAHHNGRATTMVEPPQWSSHHNGRATTMVEPPQWSSLPGCG
jgi:hypothetical protein